MNSYTVFERQFKSVVTHLALYRSENSGRYKIALVEEKHQKGPGQDMQKSMKVMEEAGMTELKVFQLDDNMQLGSLVFDHQLEFSAKCQSVLPFGVVLYNEKGHFSLVELNQSLSQG